MTLHTYRTITGEMIERLGYYWHKRPVVAASEIAREMRKEFPNFGGSLTRGAILGHVSRLRAKGANFPDRERRGGRRPRPKLPPTTPTRRAVLHQEGRGTRNRVEREERAAKQNTQRVSGKFGHFVTADKPPTDPKTLTEQPGGGALPLMQLEADQCHWPVGDDNPQLYCAQPVSGPRREYCTKHGGGKR